MSPTLVGIRVSRRALAIAVVQDETVVFVDSRHVSSRRSPSSLEAIGRYLGQTLDRVRPTRLAMYAPTVKEGLARQIADMAMETSVRRRLPMVVVDRVNLFSAFGVSPPRTRRELKARVLDICPECEGWTYPTSQLAIEALATAWVAEGLDALGPTT